MPPVHQKNHNIIFFRHIAFKFALVMPILLLAGCQVKANFFKDVIDPALVLLMFASPAFILPFILGLVILVKYRKDDLSRLAGVFTFKPIIATPLWAVIFQQTTSVPVMLPEAADKSHLLTPLYILTLLPGATLTLLIVIAFRKLYAQKSKWAYVLLGLDMLRWLNTFFAHLIWVRPYGLSTGWFLYIAGMVLPNVYAVIALVISIIQARNATHEV